MIYFTSDLHLGHQSIIRMQNRDFDDENEMNTELINNINARVHKNDTIYFLGDISHRIPVNQANELISKIKGKKVLIRGNHDRKYDPLLFEGIYDFLEIHINGQNFSLMHYPMLEWPKSRHGSIHLHGHQHNPPEYNLQQKSAGIRRYDVGVDGNYYCPVSVNEILRFMDIS